MGFSDREKKREAGRGIVSAIAGTSDEVKIARTAPGRPKSSKETKKRVSLAILPSLYGDIQKIAYVERKSTSEIITGCLKHYAAQNAAKLEEYTKIKGN